MSKLYIVKNVSGVCKLFTNKPTLMTQKKVGNRSNIPFNCDPVWVYYDKDKDTMLPGCTISSVIVRSLGIDYNAMSYQSIYEFEINQVI